MTDILIEFDHSNEKIYYDNVDANSDYAHIFKDGIKWGGQYHRKPECQEIYEYEVKSALENICAAEYKDDVRPKLYDLNSKETILIDSGAAVSIWPRRQFSNVTADPTTFLKAVNGSKLKTYGTFN